MKRGITLARAIQALSEENQRRREGDPLAADDPRMVALLAYIT